MVWARTGNDIPGARHSNKAQTRKKWAANFKDRSGNGIGLVPAVRQRCWHKEIRAALISVKRELAQTARIAIIRQPADRGKTVEIVYFTLVGIGLYFASDWILDRIETVRGVRFENRSVVFFVIILVLAVASFQLISYFKQS